jgi:hypothetical protein
VGNLFGLPEIERLFGGLRFISCHGDLSTPQAELGQRYYFPVRSIRRHSGMRQRFKISLSLACLAVIFWGAGYARGRERLRQTDLHAVYQQVNRDSFGSNLPDVSVKWAELPDDYGVAIFYPNGTVEIEIDRASVTSEEQLLETMRHESCHVMTHAVVEETRQDWHGEAFQGCMKRFE